MHKAQGEVHALRSDLDKAEKEIKKLGDEINEEQKEVPKEFEKLKKGALVKNISDLKKENKALEGMKIRIFVNQHFVYFKSM